MEFSLKPPNRDTIYFMTFEELLNYIKKRGEIDGWLLRVYHL